MSMERWIAGQTDKGAVNMGKTLLNLYGDIVLPSVATPASDAVAAVERQTLSQDQLILPETQIPQYVSDVLKRAEEAGLTFFEPYHVSGVTLDKDSNVHGWDKKPERWYWEQIKKGNISQDAPKLPDSWVLIDKTQKPDYKDGKQLHENDPLGSLLAKLRKDKKIQKIRGIPETSRFGISSDELATVVFPEIAKLLEVETYQVRSLREIEFSVIGNFKHPEWGETNTLEWFDDKFGDSHRLVGGRSDVGGLALVNDGWSGDRYDGVAFRPLVVLSPKA